MSGGTRARVCRDAAVHRTVRCLMVVVVMMMVFMLMVVVIMMIDVVMVLVVVVLIKMTMPEVGCLQMKDRLVVIFNFSLVSNMFSGERRIFLCNLFKDFLSFKLQHTTRHTPER